MFFQKNLYKTTLVLCSFIVVVDEIFKFIALKTFPILYGQTESFIFFQLALHKNYGIAFNIPFKRSLLILLTFLILFFLLAFIKKNWKTKPKLILPFFLIFAGALGNLFDRIVYGFTVDYLIFFGTSAINLSDILIVFGIFSLLFTTKKFPPKESS